MGGIIIRAVIGGFLSVRFACSPGTVTPPDPGTVTFIDPAPAFQTTAIEEEPPPVDNPPTANAGADQTVDEGATVTLNGSGSDPDGEAVTFSWTQTGGPAVTLTGANTATPSFTAPAVDADTPLTFSLEVCDEANPVSLCATDTVTVTVQDVPPGASTISINDPAAVVEGGAVTFTVSLSAPQAGTVTVDYATSDGSATAPGTTRRPLER